ncbi:GNAT family N-acetyltransferase [Sporosarcina sp. ACRSL]|uniref:GNAT family N-acetyltransferase n=1 Tax=Sporosarcina sp. ACRSL TaxID=2918215 RepID=UPI001EF456E3|nr:GNAT family N-acetyltransferase [Sporosarcina sp. ACRSL]MCG7344604.1 GNAT family N-acetyltransferase [Sporosarcina sp. ACRSL]
MKQDIILRNGQKVTIRNLTVNELGPIIELQEKVIGSLEVASFLQPLSEEEFRYILKGNGTMIGAFYGNRLIAFRAMLEPEIDEHHLGRDAGLPETELPTVLYSEVTNVDPDYRGNKLQQLLGQLLMENVDKNRYRYVCATVAPFNIASLKDKFALGMHIVSVEKKYGHVLRYTFIKDLAASDKPSTIGITVDMSDVMEQQSLLADGWVGIGLEQVDDSWKVKYAKKD